MIRNLLQCIPYYAGRSYYLQLHVHTNLLIQNGVYILTGMNGALDFKKKSCLLVYLMKNQSGYGMMLETRRNGFMFVHEVNTTTPVILYINLTEGRFVHKRNIHV